MAGNKGSGRAHFHDRERAEGFGADALAYDRYRPAYPSELIAWLCKDGVGRAVDVGCGTGLVARMLTANGWTVTGVEPDERMATVARRHGLTVETARFEDWKADRSYDLVCSGQAWHWIDPDVGYIKAASALRPGGRLAFFWNFYQYEERTGAAIRAAFQRQAPRLWTDSVHLGNASPHDVVTEDDLRARLGPDFEEPEWRTFAHQRLLAVDDWLAEAATHSPIARLDQDLRESLFEELSLRLTKLGRQVQVHHETLVTSARRKR